MNFLTSQDCLWEPLLYLYYVFIIWILDIDSILDLINLIFLFFSHKVAFNGTAIPVSFVVFKDDTLFPSERLRRRQENYTQSVAAGTTGPSGDNGYSVAPQSHRFTKVLGPILSASVAGGMAIINLSDPVVIEFGTEEVGISLRTNTQSTKLEKRKQNKRA